MVLSITTYTDPGTVIGEVAVPSGSNVASQPVVPTIIGAGLRTRGITDQSVLRGQVTGLDISAQFASGAPRRAVMTSDGLLPTAGDLVQSNKRLENTTLYRDGRALNDTLLEWLPGSVLGSGPTIGPFNLDAGAAGTNLLAYELDGRAAITHLIEDGIDRVVPLEPVAAGAVAINFVAGNQTEGTRLNIRTNGAADGTELTLIGDTVEGGVGVPIAYTGITSSSDTLTPQHWLKVTSYEWTAGGGAGNFAIGTAEDVRVIGNQVETFTLFVGNAIPSLVQLKTAVEAEEVAGAINLALVNSADYGDAYADAASATGASPDGPIQVTSPLATPSSRVEFFDHPLEGSVKLAGPTNWPDSAVGTILGADNSGSLSSPQDLTNRLSVARLELKPPGYRAGAVYTLDYVRTDLTEDALTDGTITVDDITAVGSLPQLANFEEDADWAESSPLGDAVAWDDGLGSLHSAAEFIGAAPGAGPLVENYNIVDNVNDSLSVRLNGQDYVEMDLIRAAALTPSDEERVAGERIRLEFVAAHNLITGDVVVTSKDYQGTLFFEAEGQFTVTVIDDKNLYLDGTEGDGLAIAASGGIGATVTPLEHFIVGYLINLDSTVDGTAGVGFENSTNAANVAQNINALFCSAYGPRFDTASEDTAFAVSRLAVTSAGFGVSQSITLRQLLNDTGNNASLTLFKISTSDLPQTDTGLGRQPSPGAEYFVSYDIERVASDYNKFKRFFSVEQATSDLGEATGDNQLSLAVLVAFQQGANSVGVVQVNDLDDPGNPQPVEFQAALNAVGESTVVTDIIPLSTNLQVQVATKDHVEFESSPVQAQFRRGWFGMADGTLPGDIDTVDTYVYRAVRTMAVPPNSPGRGRFFLVAPPQQDGVTVDVQLSSGEVERVDVDSTFLAVALAARRAFFSTPADTLASKSVSGFNIDDITSPWLKAERGAMASQGVMVVTFDAGVLKVLDPVSTERGGGALPQFYIDSTSYQKDNVTRKVTAAINNNLVGVVPLDIEDFLIDVKVLISDVIGGEIAVGSIGPYRDDANITRPINLSKDIQVEVARNDPTKFKFRYTYFLRYPALRFEGEFSVDNPFFGS